MQASSWSCHCPWIFSNDGLITLSIVAIGLGILGVGAIGYTYGYSKGFRKACRLYNK